ncbi:MAG: hypothetical protein ACRD50_10090 [Candidatus Acidiferrales bacterium]
MKTDLSSIFLAAGGGKGGSSTGIEDDVLIEGFGTQKAHFCGSSTEFESAVNVAIDFLDVADIW